MMRNDKPRFSLRKISSKKLKDIIIELYNKDRIFCKI